MDNLEFYDYSTVDNPNYSPLQYVELDAHSDSESTSSLIWSFFGFTGMIPVMKLLI